VIPCLNEAENVEECITRSFAALTEIGQPGEVILVDNGSDDGSGAIAQAAGAKVVSEPRRGYGSAYLAGFAAAQGDYIVMLDADLTYDFGDIPRFVEELDRGADLVMGNRRGGIRPGAMPWVHRRLGNPVMSAVLNAFFRTGVGDVWCGMRGFRRNILPLLELRATGMEFALEMVIRASKEDIDVREIPIELHPRGGVSKLARYRDGWRGLRFMLVHSPLYLFTVPAVAAVMLGVLLTALALLKVAFLGEQAQLHSMILGALLVVFGAQIGGLGLLARAYASYFMGERHGRFDRLRARVGLEHGLVLGAAVAASGLVLALALVIRSIDRGLSGLLDERVSIVAATLFIVGMQVVFTSFMISILGLRRRAVREPRAVASGRAVAHSQPVLSDRPSEVST
jgi:glycosyltransferase involved in cell wall biosynthesis